MNKDKLVPWYEIPRKKHFFTGVAFFNFVFSVRELAILFNKRKLAAYFQRDNGTIYAVCPYCNSELDEDSCSKEKCPQCNKKFYGYL